MANSPLDFFRRHKGLVMGTMLLSMVLFVLGSSVEGIFSGLGLRTSTPTDAVFTWSGGTVDEQEMFQMRQAHGMCVRFLMEVRAAAEKKGATPRGMMIPQSNDEDTVVGTLLLAEKAKHLGVTMTRESVLEYLKELSGLALTDEEINKILGNVTGGTMTANGLLDQLKHELLAQHVRLLLMPDDAISLAEAWDYHNRLYRRVSIEAYPINVADYVDQVQGTPTEAEKREMFDKYRFNSADPESPDPGFFRPAKMSFDYLKVDFAPFLKKAQEEVTEEDIKKEYDLGVERGEYKVPVKDEKPEEKKPDGETPEGTTPSTEDKKPDGEDKEEKVPEKAEEKKPAEENKAAEEGTPNECFQEEKEEPKATDPAKPAEAADPVDPAKPETDPAKPATDPADPTKPATDPADPAVPVDPTKPPPKKEPEMRVQTLGEVRDAIRTRLAQPIAQQAKDKVVEAVLKELNEFGEKYLANSEAKAGGEKPKEELKPLDVEVLARKYGFEGKKVPLSNRYEVTNYELGKDGIFFRDLSTIDFRNFDPESFRTPFPDEVYRSLAPEYQPRNAASATQPDIDYIFWVTGSQEAEQPKYDDKVVQEELVNYWKRDKAVELAKKAAEEFAAKADSKATLKEVLPEEEQKKLITPPPFSWFTLGSVPFGQQRPRLSKVEGIDLVADEFMQPVCTAPEKKAVVGVNYPRTTVYAVKVLSQTPSDDLLRFQFQASGITPPIQMLSGGRINQIYFGRMEEIVEEFSLKWNRTPNSGGSS